MTTTKTKAGTHARLKLAAANAALALAQDQIKPDVRHLGRAGRWLTAVHLGHADLKPDTYRHVIMAAVVCAMGAGEDHMETLREIRGYGPASLAVEGQYASNLLRVVLDDPETSARVRAHAERALDELKAASLAQAAMR